MKLRTRVLVLTALTVFCSLTASFLRNKHESEAKDFAALANQAQLKLQVLIADLEKRALAISPIVKADWLNERSLTAKLNGFPKEDSFHFFIYESGKLKYWSGNDTYIHPEKLQKAENGKLNLLGNGWYYLLRKQVGNRELVGAIPVQQQYMLQNQYLVNTFNPYLELPTGTRLYTRAIAGTWAITDSQNGYLFSLAFPAWSKDHCGDKKEQWLYGFAVFFFLLLVLDVLVSLGRKGSAAGWLILLALFAGRYFMLIYGVPVSLYESEFFSPQYYASDFLLNSPGDLMLSMALLVCVIVYLHTLITVSQIGKTPARFFQLWSILVFVATFLFSVLINYLMSGLIINSQISFNIGNVFELSAYSLAGILVIGMLLLSFYLMCDAGVSFIRKAHPGFLTATMLFLVSQGVFLLLLLLLRNTILFADYGTSAFLLTNGLILFISYVRSNEKRLFSFSRTVLVILAFSLYAARIIYDFNILKEHDKRESLAARLENEQDVVAEYLFRDIAPKLSNDYNLRQLFLLPVNDVISQPTYLDELNKKLMRQYFSGYLGRYEVHFKFFNANDIPINRSGDPTWNLDEYEKNIAANTKPTYSDQFYYLPSESGKISYLGKIEIRREEEKLGLLLVELTTRSSQEENGLPDLLMSEKAGKQKDLANYSFARYVDGKLVSQHGAFNYYLTAAPYEEYFKDLDGMRFSHFDRYSHLFDKYGKNTLIIISAPEQDYHVFITLFSYLFSCFSLLFLLLYLSVRFVRNGFRLEINFKSRIQLTVMAIVAATLLLIGIATITYIYGNYEQAQDTRLREKMNNVRVLVQNEMGNRSSLGSTLSDDLTYAFGRLSSTLQIDFNVFSLNGLLLYTSQPRIYEQELIAPLINREAWQGLTANQKALYIQHEHIGQLTYQAAYEPLRNSEDKIIGYVNLPYFAKESELRKDISEFLVALINIYVLLFSFAVLVAFIISNRITEPLRIIQEGLKRTKLGKSTQPLHWKTKDEIGALINEYNRMVTELQQSAERLAQSERESAWREMAKQVAHEIKNPLTPMKLGVQHLQRAMADDQPNKTELVQKICTTLVEQIDTLSNIATAFGNFARMPGSAYKNIALNSLLEHTADLYNESGQGIVLYQDSGELLHILGDKDQLLRIFSNLVKNSIQAIPEDREGRINIQMTKEESQVIIQIKDNGVGIPQSQLASIFQPNFTTKSSGTGLGLAMVKNLVEGMQGQIWFETEVGQGTTFYIRFPLIEAG